ncbi:LacI family DNA-binding transcriptional regulator [Kribbella sp. NPDC023972]|uniref:LacI family DNA-binding transcriptional regulator n=1 Tax=Kribbella sp. NPDC023972 TaxID=3154795 RepID=UPI0033C80390
MRVGLRSHFHRRQTGSGVQLVARWIGKVVTEGLPGCCQRLTVVDHPGCATGCTSARLQVSRRVVQAVVTLADVARMSATSRSTASRALKGDPRISEETADRVRLVAKALGYRPNVAARTLATGRSGIFGLIVPSSLMDDVYGAQLVSAVTTAAGEHDGGVMLWLSHDRPSRAIRETVSNGIIDGLVVSILAQNEPWIDELLDSGLPCVLIGRHSSRTDTSYAAIDNITATRALMEHLRDQGYMRVATIRGPIGNTDAEERHSVFIEAMGGADQIDANLVAVGDFSYESGYDAAAALLRHGPDCIVAGNDPMAMGALAALRAAGLRIPEDIGVSGWDDVRDANRIDVRLTTVHHDMAAVGREAVEILLKQMGGVQGPIRRTVPASLVIRESTLRTSGNEKEAKA